MLTPRILSRLCVQHRLASVGASRPVLRNGICLHSALVRHSGTLSSPPAPPKSWVEHLPAKMRPYLYLARVDKPIGTWLLFYPCTWSITMASYALQTPFTVPLTYISLFGIGAFVMRGAGCTINDMWDRNLDKAVARTKERPLARGDITPIQAVGFLGLQLSAGLAVLTQLNWYSILLGASSLSVVTIYPFMKRITYWPQAVLGLAFNWGALLGWSAVADSVNWSVALPLYAGGFCWTLVYDSIYAHQDKTDDVTVGIRSTALLFGEQTRPILSALSASSVSLIALAGYMNAQGPLFYAGTGLAALQLARVVARTEFNDRPSCWRGFVGCGWAGFWIWMGGLADYIALMPGVTA
ncbi:4-hydroxybenzoate polyprenyl transferase [Wolfiporia cocos MD-104 SS10]|uniref:4-hydroxybenzoate polyprenyltransferase, mitochondrial n=1 Tax=Wolfiporia cocos (strain MD-104) TaxID=742152 RepID=A0A2H3JR68_WOLCO|nr:4-hydroxybenzoate polyprenyl transferase [Wolfiporia cocos MD-104 SS10]